MIRRIDHIAIAVHDLDRAREFFLDQLGGKELISVPVPEEAYRWTSIELGESCMLELVDPLGDDGFLHRFLESRGEGMHHITIHVDDLAASQRELEAKGVPTFGYNDSEPNWKVFYVHPKDAFGALLQFAEFEPLSSPDVDYIPVPYLGFVPPEVRPVEVQPIETEAGPAVQLTDGVAKLAIAADRIPDLVRRLEDVARGGSSGD
jgi:methylmalonyl-CoA epimerase